MKEKLLSKELTVAVILLFIGLAIQPSVAVKPETEIAVEPKDYLFQTIIDIANNPEVKELFEQYEPDMFKVDIDRGVYNKIFLRNPRMLFQLIFTKPSISLQYLNFIYNQGIKTTNILGEDKVLEIVESTKVNDLKYFDKLNNIILKDEELSYRYTILEELCKELKSDLQYWDEYPLLCVILVLYLIAIYIIFIPLSRLYYNILKNIPIISKIFEGIFFMLCAIPLGAFFWFCIGLPTYV